jgi:hypothetical protein
MLYAADDSDDGDYDDDVDDRTKVCLIEIHK